MFNKKVFYSIVIIIGLVILSPRVSFGAEQFSRDLSFGFQQDSDVTKLQEFLSDEGLYSGPITGNFFSLTLRAVKAFQSREEITPAAGYFGPKTRVRANALLGAQVQASNQQAVAETGQNITQPVIPQTTNNSVSNMQSQLEALLKQVALLQQQLQTQQQNQITETTVSSTQTQTQTQTQTPQSPNYKLSILSFEPIYADIDYETPPNRALNHYKLEIQFNDENNVINFIDGNLKIFLENKFFQGVTYFGGEQYSLSNLPIYDNFKETETKLSNPFIFKYTLTRFPKNQNELDNYFLIVTYKDQRYRIPIGNYFSFQHIPECDQLVSDFMNNSDVIGFFGGKGWYSSERLDSVKNNSLALVKQKQCYISLRYTEMRSCFLNLYSSMCTTLKENSI